jgi:hypothetical protein
MGRDGDGDGTGRRTGGYRRGRGEGDRLDLLGCDRSAVIGEGQRERKNLFSKSFLN